ncbi:glutamate racemase [Clostridium botulinum]|uniref:glutamate racemase n=1 Tax=Clostridium TaxID=1485 RepID=UPI00031D4A43|nr:MULTISPECIES: glutamate racemase [Clostridium]AIY79322.1 glutamate racemase [Clostridium botulinum 202F]KAI3345281.1 glutamate racemase [Clostridium botulinum]KFX57781.1 glutamate racemase [Clostridium botulinum]KFX59945.1 glutamate racemase [Clostridium botulinum]KON11556.1 glutamate racemase [Clostridium botulinum]
MDKKNRPIGFFDSGVGGLSVMKEAIRLMPNENYIYFGDSKNAPYGVKTVEEVRTLTFNAVESLLEKNVKAIVVACNTATSAAIDLVRSKYKNIPIIGIEPALKLATKYNRKGNIIIMATPMTLKENKFKSLMEKYGENYDIVSLPCAKLVEFIEHGILSGEELEEYLKEKFKPYKNNDIGVVVLGCTHYPFIKETLYKVIDKDIPIIDGGLGTSQELRRRLEEKNLLNTEEKQGSITIINSNGSEKMIELSKKLIEIS